MWPVKGTLPNSISLVKASNFIFKIISASNHSILSLFLISLLCGVFLFLFEIQSPYSALAGLKLSIPDQSSASSHPSTSAS